MEGNVLGGGSESHILPSSVQTFPEHVATENTHQH